MTTPPHDWHSVALTKLTNVLGPRAAAEVMAEGLQKLGLPQLTSSEELSRFARLLADKGGFAAAVAGLLDVHVAMYGDHAPPRLNPVQFGKRRGESAGRSLARRAVGRPPPTPPSLRSGGDLRRTPAPVGRAAGRCRKPDAGRRTPNAGRRSPSATCSQGARLAQGFAGGPLLSAAKGGSGGPADRAATTRRPPSTPRPELDAV